MLLGSRETVVNYLHATRAAPHYGVRSHHYGPGPWVDDLGRADWTSVYYHRADAQGLGFDRTAAGSNALAQYAPEWQKLWGDPATCPENLLLWFHHVAWDHPMKSGRPLWDELCLRYQQGVDEVRVMQRDWDSLKGRVDDERFTGVQQRLARHGNRPPATGATPACCISRKTFSHQPLPASASEPPAHAPRLLQGGQAARHAGLLRRQMKRIILFSLPRAAAGRKRNRRVAAVKPGVRRAHGAPARPDRPPVGLGQTRHGSPDRFRRPPCHRHCGRRRALEAGIEPPPAGGLRAEHRRAAARSFTTCWWATSGFAPGNPTWNSASPVRATARKR